MCSSDLGTYAEQQTLVGTLATMPLQAKDIPNPSMIVVGEVVKLHEKIQWLPALATV